MPPRLAATTSSEVKPTRGRRTRAAGTYSLRSQAHLVAPAPAVDLTAARRSTLRPRPGPSSLLKRTRAENSVDTSAKPRGKRPRKNESNENNASHNLPNASARGIPRRSARLALKLQLPEPEAIASTSSSSGRATKATSPPRTTKSRLTRATSSRAAMPSARQPKQDKTPQLRRQPSRRGKAQTAPKLSISPPTPSSSSLSSPPPRVETPQIASVHVPSPPPAPSPSSSASSSFHFSFPSSSSSAESSEPNSPLAPYGETTRVEIAYGSLFKELLRSETHASLIDDVAGRVLDTAPWRDALETYTETARVRRLGRSTGDRKNRFVDLMNCVLEQAPLCGLNVPYAHDIQYGRHQIDGVRVVPAPRRSSRTASPGDHKLPTPPSEPWQNDRWCPCLGVVAPARDSNASVWTRAAVIIDVYNASSEHSPPESPAGPVKRKLSEDAAASPRRSKRRRVPEGAGPSADYPDARLSYHKLDEGWYSQKQPDDNLKANVARVFRKTGNRRHIIGVYVKGLEVRFYLYDHAGTIYTTALDLRTDARRIVEAIISLSFLDAFSLGLEPVLASNPAKSPSELFQTPAGCYIDVGGTPFYAESLKHAPSLFGRGTVVYEAIPARPDDKGHPVPVVSAEVPEEVILKLAWQMPSANSEEELLRLAADRGVGGIARLYASTTLGRLSDGIRGRLVPATMYADRELRIQVTGPRATPLTQVADLETFKTAFRSLVKAHHDLFEKAGILHRDISVNNLMVNAKNPNEGVLIDFDVAARVDKNGDPVSRDTFPHVGTLEFRAFELVMREPPQKAYYRHDLESFLYVLFWIQAHYKDGVKLPKPNTKILNFPFQGTWDATKELREGFLLTYDDDHLQPPPSSLRDCWLVPLRAMFGIANDRRLNALILARDGKGEVIDDITLGGMITYQTFCDIIRA